MAEDHADRSSEQTLRMISAALDGEAPMPDDVDGDGATFADTALHLRRAVRLEVAEIPPDVTDAVLAEIRRRDRGDGRATRPGMAVAAAFVAAAVVAALLVGPGWRQGASTAAADLGERAQQTQHAVQALDAEVTLIEQGAHPEVPVRRYTGTLRYRAPEQLHLALDDVSALPAGWPAGDLQLVIDDGLVWHEGLRGCPVAEQPDCLGGPRSRALVGLPPFAADVAAPLDLVLPVAGLAGLPEPAGQPTAGGGDGADLVVAVTVARIQPLTDALTGIGTVRRVHPGDPVELRLDPDTLVLRGLSIRAGEGEARATWAATNGYRDQPGDPVLDLQLVPLRSPLPPPEVPAGPPDVDAGFVDDQRTPPVRPTSLPDGLTRHRSGHLRDGGPVTWVTAYSDGRAWLRVEATEAWTADVLPGDLGPLVRAIPVGSGVGWTGPQGDAVALHADGWDVVVTGSVPLPSLVAVAASLIVDGTSLVGLPLPDGWPQADAVEVLPSGALRPDGPLLARREPGGILAVAVPGPGSSGALLRQQRLAALPPPVKADVVEVVVRGTAGRWSAPLGLLTWAEEGWVHELTSAGLDLEGMLAVAEDLS